MQYYLPWLQVAAQVDIEEVIRGVVEQKVRHATWLARLACRGLGAEGYSSKVNKSTIHLPCREVDFARLQGASKFREDVSTGETAAAAVCAGCDELPRTAVKLLLM